MNSQLEKMICVIKNHKKLIDFFREECDIEFSDADNLALYLNDLASECRSNYALEAFGQAADGNLYVLLDDEKVGIITTEGQAGLIADNVNNFFSILIGCRYPTDYAKGNRLDSKEIFLEYYNRNLLELDENVKAFMDEFDLTGKPDSIFTIFRKAVFETTPLQLNSLSDDYEDFEQIFDLSLCKI